MPKKLLKLNQAVVKGQFLTFPRRRFFYNNSETFISGNKVFFTKRSVSVHVSRAETFSNLQNLRQLVKTKIETLLKGETVQFLTLKVVNIHTSVSWSLKFNICIQHLCEIILKNTQLKIDKCMGGQEQNLGVPMDLSNFIGEKNSHQLFQLFHLSLSFIDKDFPNSTPLVKLAPGKKGSEVTNITFIFCAFSPVTREIISVLENGPQSAARSAAIGAAKLQSVTAGNDELAATATTAAVVKCSITTDDVPAVSSESGDAELHWCKSKSASFPTNSSTSISTSAHPVLTSVQRSQQRSAPACSNPHRYLLSNTRDILQSTEGGNANNAGNPSNPFQSISTSIPLATVPTCTAEKETTAISSASSFSFSFPVPREEKQISGETLYLDELWPSTDFD